MEAGRLDRRSSLIAEGFDTQLASLRARFTRRLESDIDELDAHLGALATGDLDSLDKLEGLAHKLAGTAGSFGFAIVGKAAQALEGEVSAFRAGSVPIEQLERTALSLRLTLGAALSKTRS